MKVSGLTRIALSLAARLFRSDDELGDIRIDKDDTTAQLLAWWREEYAGDRRRHRPFRPPRHDACQNASAAAFRTGVFVDGRPIFLRRRRRRRVILVGDSVITDHRVLMMHVALMRGHRIDRPRSGGGMLLMEGNARQPTRPENQSERQQSSQRDPHACHGGEHSEISVPLPA